MGLRVTGDTMLGCGACRRCRSQRHHVCENRSEIGIRGSYAGALAEKLRVPAGALLRLPDDVDDTAGAMVEPGGNALRAVRAAAVTTGERLLVVGTGTIGLLAAQFAGHHGVQVHLAGVEGPGLEFARACALGETSALVDLPDVPFDAVIDASNGMAVPAQSVRLVEPGRRVVFIGLSPEPSLVDSREIALKDVTAVGILGASAGLPGTISAYAAGAVDPRPLVAAVVGPGSGPRRAGRVATRPCVFRTQDPRRPTTPGDDMSDFDGLTALVTGGASGIGAATARLLVARGAQVAILDRAPSGDSGLIELSCDITDRHAVNASVAEAAEALGGIDVLVNNAGIGAIGDVSENDDAEWAHLLDVNVVGIARVSTAALPHLRASEHAAVVNVSSVVAAVGVPQRALYSASKGAVAALTLAMAADHVREGIRVNAVAPRHCCHPVDRSPPRAVRRPGRRRRGTSRPAAHRPPRRGRRGRPLDRLPSQPAQCLHHRDIARGRRRDERDPATELSRPAFGGAGQRGSASSRSTNAWLCCRPPSIVAAMTAASSAAMPHTR